MKPFLYTFLAIAIFFSCSKNKQGDDSPSGQWETLITGNELTGWEKQGNFSSSLQDGVLTLEGEKEGGWLFYKKEYEDFIFEVDFLVHAESKSGIAFRYIDEQGVDPAFSSYKVTIDHNLDQQNPTGSIFNVARAKSLKSTK